VLSTRIPYIISRYYIMHMHTHVRTPLGAPKRGKDSCFAGSSAFGRLHGRCMCTLLTTRTPSRCVPFREGFREAMRCQSSRVPLEKRSDEGATALSRPFGASRLIDHRVGAESRREAELSLVVRASSIGAARRTFSGAADRRRGFSAESGTRSRG